VVNKLAEMFATSVIGNNYVKKGLLLCAASTSTDKSSKKLNAILVGDPGLAKSLLLKKSTRLVPNSRYESVQFATGKSLTAIVTKEEGDALILRIGPIPQAKGAIAALNEIGRMSYEDQGLLLDIMQEQQFTTNKFGRNFHIDAPTAIIASANPVGGSWRSYNNDNDSRIDLDKIPTIKPLLDRFDFIFIYIDNRSVSHLSEYADRKSEMEDRPTPDYTAYIAKHIMYAKQLYPKPKFSEEAKLMLNQYYVNVRANYGSPRILKTVYAIAANIGRLKLKHIVDAADARETMQLYNVILQQLDMIVALPSNPKDTTYEECLEVLKGSAFPLSYEEVVKTACMRNTQVARYVNGNSNRSLKLRDNKKLRLVLEMLQDHRYVNVIKMKPVVLQYIDGTDDISRQSCDSCDQYDLPKDTLAKNFGKNNSCPDVSLGEDENGKTATDGYNGPKTGPKNISGSLETESHRTQRAHSEPKYVPGDNGNDKSNGNGYLFRCYYCEKQGNIFETNHEQEYHIHGNKKHFNKPMYPNMATIKKYGLMLQGKEWEV
jgi:replicative DNA helicase Mcm